MLTFGVDQLERQMSLLRAPKETFRIVQQSGHDDRPERGNEMSATGERNLALERQGRVDLCTSLRAEISRRQSKGCVKFPTDRRYL